MYNEDALELENTLESIQEAHMITSIIIDGEQNIMCKCVCVCKISLSGCRVKNIFLALSSDIFFKGRKDAIHLITSLCLLFRNGVRQHIGNLAMTLPTLACMSHFLIVLLVQKVFERCFCT